MVEVPNTNKLSETSGPWEYLKAGFSSLVALLALAGTLIAIGLALFQPNVRSWFLSEACTAWWIAAALFLIVFIGARASYLMWKKIESLSSVHRDMDRELLLQRLQGWGPVGPFIFWLKNDFVVNHIPSEKYFEIESRSLNWGMDKREFRSLALRTCFDELHSAVNEFREVSISHLWFGTITHFEYYEISAEKGSAGFGVSMELIEDVRDRLLLALENIFRVSHEEFLLESV